MGIIASLVLLFLMGAIGKNRITGQPVGIVPAQETGETALAQNGRYQISSCSFSPGTGRKGGYGVFVVDTATGVTKAAYVSFVDSSGKTLHINQLGRSFARIQTGNRFMPSPRKNREKN